MDAKALTESGWKTVAQKNKIKDNGLQRALAAYENLEAEEHDKRLAQLATIDELAGTLKRSKEVAAANDVVKYLTGVLAATDDAEKEISKAKAQSEKESLAAQKKAAGRASAGEEEDEDEEEMEEDGSDVRTKILAAVQKLRSSPDLSYQFIVCDAKPVCGLMIAKRITGQHKTQLTKLTGGKRFFPPGTCHFEGGKINFSMAQPISGLARKLQLSLKELTGKKFPVVVGTESEEGDETESPAGAAAQAGAGASARTASGSQTQATPAAAAGASAGQPSSAKSRPGLAEAPQAWHGMRQTVDQNIQALKQAVRAQYADQHPDLLGEIDRNMTKLDGILEKLDHRLADSLAKAHGAANQDARANELKNAKTILADYIKYVKSEPLIAHIDANPFGVKTDLKKTLTESLTHMAQAIG